MLDSNEEGHCDEKNSVLHSTTDQFRRGGWRVQLCPGRSRRRWQHVRREVIGTLGGMYSQAYEVSSNGSVLVGYSSNPSGSYRAFRWTAATGMRDLGDFGYTYAAAYGVSGDGSIVVGEAWNASFEQRAFRWTAGGGLQDLGTLGGSYAVAADISANGLVVVGQSYTKHEQHACLSMDRCVWNEGPRHSRGFRERRIRGLRRRFSRGRKGNRRPRLVSRLSVDCRDRDRLPRRPGRRRERAVYSVSADGSVIVGRASNGNAFRWTAAGGMQDLGTLGGFGSAAYDVSDNGSVIVGDSSIASGAGRAFRWTAAGGMKNLSTTYSGSIGSGSYLDLRQCRLR